MRLVFYPIAIVLAAAVCIYALDASRLTRIASTQLNIENSTEFVWKSLLEKLSFSLYSGADDQRDRIATLREAAKKQESFATRYAFGYAFVTCLFIGIQVWRNARGAISRSSLTADLVGLSVLCLFVGLIAPVLSLKAYATAPLVGEVVLKFEAKSIFTTIKTLADSGHLFIAALVGAFSVVTPIVKTVIAGAVLQHRWPHWHSRALKLTKALGKWSMADVFVVAILVAYFAAGSDEFSEAQIGLGLYFFVAYCFLSLVVTQALVSNFSRDTASAMGASP